MAPNSQLHILNTVAPYIVYESVGIICTICIILICIICIIPYVVRVIYVILNINNYTTVLYRTVRYGIIYIIIIIYISLV